MLKFGGCISHDNDPARGDLNPRPCRAARRRAVRRMAPSPHRFAATGEGTKRTANMPGACLQPEWGANLFATRTANKRPGVLRSFIQKEKDLSKTGLSLLVGVGGLEPLTRHDALHRSGQTPADGPTRSRLRRNRSGMPTRGRGFYAASFKRKKTCQRQVFPFWSEWGDLNPRPLGPEPSTLPTALHPDIGENVLYCEEAKMSSCFPCKTPRAGIKWAQLIRERVYG